METFLLRRGCHGGPGELLAEILLFFTKAGAFVFGSGLAIVPFLEHGVVHDLHWLTDHQFLDAVAVAMITPGPVVITVAFIGYLVAGTAGAIVASIGIFLPVYVFTIIPAPWFQRTGRTRNCRRSPLGRRQRPAAPSPGRSWSSANGRSSTSRRPIGLIGLALLWKFRLQEPLLVAAAGLAGLVIWPLIRGG